MQIDLFGNVIKEASEESYEVSWTRTLAKAARYVQGVDPRKYMLIKGNDKNLVLIE